MTLERNNTHPRDVESIAGLSDSQIQERLIQQFRTLPDEAFTQTQYVSGEIGCAHACTFCCQGAGTVITRFSRRDINNLIAAIKTVATEVRGRSSLSGASGGALLGYARETHKPGVVFPYLDNDPLNYVHFDALVEGLYHDLGCKVRTSSVGYPRHNKELQAAHERIVANVPDAFAGIRFSFSKYPIDWNNPEEYIKDFANVLKTYRPVLERIGFGKEEASVELRFPPLVYSTKEQLDDTVIDGHHVVHSGKFLLISKEQAPKIVETEISGMVGRSAALSQEGYPYLILVSDKEIKDGDWRGVAESVIKQGTSATQEYAPLEGHDGVLVREGNLHLFSNSDGPYYGIDPTFREDGSFAALHVYPQTATRKVSGYLDTTRHFLNTLLAYKSEKGVERRERFSNATWDDVESLMQNLRRREKFFDTYDPETAAYIKKEVIPLMESFCAVLREAEYPPEALFSRLAFDTGVIVNQGRASVQFKGLVSRPDIPVTPQEARAFGHPKSVSDTRVPTWRWAPAPIPTQAGGGRSRAVTGVRNSVSPTHAVGYVDVAKFGDRFALPPVDTEFHRRFAGFELEEIPVSKGRELFVSGEGNT